MITSRKGVLLGRKYYPFIGDEPDEGEEVKIFMKRDDKGRPFFVDTEGKRLFTQEHMNAELSAAKKKAAEQNKTQIEQLQEMQERASTSEVLKLELQEQIENLQQASLSKEDQLVQQIKKLEGNLKVVQDSMSAERDRATNLYQEERISNALRYATDEHKAVSFEQIYGLLRNRTQLKDTVGADGKPSGEHEVLVSLETPDSEGKLTIQQLTPSAALKEMKALKDRYGNLFLSVEKGGLGAGTEQGGGPVQSETPPPEALKSMESYKAWAQANMKG